MTIKISVLAGTMVLGGLFIGCGSQEGDTEIKTAEERVDEAKVELKEAKKDVREERKAERADYWDDRERFKNENELRIKENENEIAEIRVKLDKNDKDYAEKNERIIELEERNREMKRRLDAYDDSQAATRWDEFKREFNNDMDNLGQAIKGVFKDDVK